VSFLAQFFSKIKKHKFLLLFLVFINAYAFAEPAAQQQNSFSKVHQFVFTNQGRFDYSDQTIARYHLILTGLHYQKLIKLSPSFVYQSGLRKVTEPFPSYSPPGAHMPKSLPIVKIHYMQESVHTLFGDNDLDIITLAKRLRSHRILFKSLPELHVWKDKNNIIWTINHRRLVAAVLAGNIRKAPVIWATKKEVLGNKKEYTTRNHGKSIIALLTRNLGMVVGH
jgi:ABC-type Fe3+-siderophore transport system permease subunit